MAEPTTPRRRRARRSTEVSRRLAAARQRSAEQLAEQKRKEQAADAALETYFDAGDQITAAEMTFRRRAEPHQLAVAKLQQQRDVDVAAQQAIRERAALTIHQADRTVEQVGELLGLGEKAARRLIAAGRAAEESEAGENSGGQHNSTVAFGAQEASEADGAREGDATEGDEPLG